MRRQEHTHIYLYLYISLYISTCIYTYIYEIKRQKVELLRKPLVSTESACLKSQHSLKGPHYSCLTNLICRCAITLFTEEDG